MTNAERRNKRVFKKMAIAPDTEIVEKAWNENTALVDGDRMAFRDDEVGMNWGELANDYVLDMRNKRIKYWI
mgnify:FL=1